MGRSPVKVIEVRVRQKNNVNLWKLNDSQRRVGQSLRTQSKEKWNSNSDSRKQDGVGKDFDTKEVDEHGRMPEPCSGQIRITPGIRLRVAKVGAIGFQLFKIACRHK